ncbi:dihydrolipoamide acetyltransferase family protein [Corynebacterium provencense]|uniref:dihydrolipoamide acetyltransferase family protein n=1 Tax=Corynebacterium provencense TaxID=1737425 RepID=UPI000836B50C|nr:dihydrolipoamide acetyltransferase family protein [Corynebacterium provencense]
MSSIRPIEVPKWGMTMDEGTIDEWYLAEGDSFSEGDLLCSIESTKVMNDLAANFDGVLRRIVAHSGDVLPVGSLIGVAADPSVDDSEIDAYIAERTGGSGDADGSADTDGEDATSTPAAESSPAAPAGTPAATPPAAQAAAQSVPRFGLDRPDTQVGSAASPGTTGGAAAVLPGDVANTPEAVPFTGMRRAIATRLQQSAQTSPHFRVNQEVQIDELLALRRQINATVPAVKVSVNDLIVKAVATTLLRVPEVNVQFDEATQTVLRFPSADVSVAVSVPDGLITPIVRAADRKTLSQISEDIRDLAIRAKAGNLLPDEFQGGTFTVSNLGMFGVSSFDAVINPPQAAILAVGAGVRRPVVLDDGSVEPRTVLTLSLAADHRVIDGALAATFIGELKGILEQPAQMLV